MQTQDPHKPLERLARCKNMFNDNNGNNSTHSNYSNSNNINTNNNNDNNNRGGTQARCAILCCLPCHSTLNEYNQTHRAGSYYTMYYTSLYNTALICALLHYNILSCPVLSQTRLYQHKVLSKRCLIMA